MSIDLLEIYYLVHFVKSWYGVASGNCKRALLEPMGASAVDP
jgi:hypothetical protein